MPIPPNTKLANAELTQFGLTEQEVQHTLGVVKVRDVDYADLYFESCLSESVSMEEGIVKRAVKSVSQGAGVRATAGEKTGFAYSDELTRRDLEIAAGTARYIAQSPQGGPPVPVTHCVTDSDPVSGVEAADPLRWGRIR